MWRTEKLFHNKSECVWSEGACNLSIRSSPSSKHYSISTFASICCYKGERSVTVLLNGCWALTKMKYNTLGWHLLCYKIPDLGMQLKNTKKKKLSFNNCRKRLILTQVRNLKKYTKKLLATRRIISEAYWVWCILCGDNQDFSEQTEEGKQKHVRIYLFIKASENLWLANKDMDLSAQSSKNSCKFQSNISAPHNTNLVRPWRKVKGLIGCDHQLTPGHLGDCCSPTHWNQNVLCSIPLALHLYGVCIDNLKQKSSSRFNFQQLWFMAILSQP